MKNIERFDLYLDTLFKNKKLYKFYNTSYGFELMLRHYERANKRLKELQVIDRPEYKTLEVGAEAYWRLSDECTDLELWRSKQ